MCFAIFSVFVSHMYSCAWVYSYLGVRGRVCVCVCAKLLSIQLLTAAEKCCHVMNSKYKPSQVLPERTSYVAISDEHFDCKRGTAREKYETSCLYALKCDWI